MTIFNFPNNFQTKTIPISWGENVAFSEEKPTLKMI